MNSRFTSRVFRSIAGIGAATMLGNLLAIAASPLVSRLFTPADMGQFGLFFNLATVLTTVAMLGLQDALFAARDDDDALSILRAATLAGLATAPILGLVSLAVIRFQLFGYGALPASAALLVTAEILAISALTLVQVWTIRRMQFRRLAWSHLTQGAARAGTQITAGLAGSGFPGLAFAEILTRISVSLLLFRGAANDFRASVRVPWQKSVRTAWRYRVFVIFRTLSTFLFNAGTALPPALIAAAHGVSASGQYTLMFGVIMMPAGLIQKAVGDVFLGHFRERFSVAPERARGLVFVTAASLLAVAACSGAVLFVFGPDLFAFIFGPQWREAGILARLMVPLFIADMTIGPLGSVLNVANRPDAKLVFDLLRIGGFSAAYFVTSATNAALPSTVTLIAWFGALSYIVYFGLIVWAIYHPRPVNEASASPTNVVPGHDRS